MLIETNQIVLYLKSDTDITKIYIFFSIKYFLITDSAAGPDVHGDPGTQQADLREQERAHIRGTPLQNQPNDSPRRRRIAPRRLREGNYLVRDQARCHGRKYEEGGQFLGVELFLLRVAEPNDQQQVVVTSQYEEDFS